MDAPAGHFFTCLLRRAEEHRNAGGSLSSPQPYAFYRHHCLKCPGWRRLLQYRCSAAVGLPLAGSLQSFLRSSRPSTPLPLRGGRLRRLPGCRRRNCLCEHIPPRRPNAAGVLGAGRSPNLPACSVALPRALYPPAEGWCERRSNPAWESAAPGRTREPQAHRGGGGVCRAPGASPTSSAHPASDKLPKLGASQSWLPRAERGGAAGGRRGRRQPPDPVFREPGLASLGSQPALRPPPACALR